MSEQTTVDLSSDQLWARRSADAHAAETLVAPSRSITQETIRRFLGRKSVMIGLATVVLLLAFAFLGPLFTGYKVNDQHLTHANLAPRLHTTRLAFPDGAQQNFLITTDLKVLPISDGGKVGEPLKRLSDDVATKVLSYEYVDSGGAKQKIEVGYSMQPAAILQGGQPLTADNTVWNSSYRLGSDSLGRDLLTRLMYGTQISLIVALLAATINLTIGVTYGLVAGYFGGRVDAVMMRIVDIIDTIPLTLYVILLLVLINSGLLSIVIALSSVYWVSMARVVRGQVHSIKQQEFVVAARTIGSSTGYILRRHLLPNALGSILVTATMLIPQAIFIEAFLSFIGLGVASPQASLGTMSNDAVQALRTAPYQLAFPSIVICIAMFAFTFIGDGLREALDPKLRRR